MNERSVAPGTQSGAWRPLPFTEWTDTLETLQLWMQIIGKIRLASSPWVNHSWSVPLYVSPTGLRTSLVAYRNEGFEWSFDFIAHRLELVTTNGYRRTLVLKSRSVADFYGDVMAAMQAAGMPVTIDTTPNEVPDPVAFPSDTKHRTYEPDHAHAFWRALVDANRVFTRFRAGYLGKVSPVHFFWGSFDLAVTRFSGRLAPTHPGGVPGLPDDIVREAYSHEVSSCGFWVGDRTMPEPVFYAYAYPAPTGYAEAPIGPDEAHWDASLGEFVLRYSDVIAASDRDTADPDAADPDAADPDAADPDAADPDAADPDAADPDAVVLKFIQSAHDIAADLGKWDRADLECVAPYGPDWWRERPPGGYPPRPDYSGIAPADSSQ